MRKPSLLASSISASSVRQPSGRTWDCSHREGDRPPGLLGQPAEQADLAHLVLEVRHDLQPAGAGRAHGMGDRRQLGLLGAQGRDAAAVGGAVIERARRREAERAGAQAFDGQLGHAPTVRPRSPARRSAPRSPIT